MKRILGSAVLAALAFAHHFLDKLEELPVALLAGLHLRFDGGRRCDAVIAPPAFEPLVRCTFYTTAQRCPSQDLENVRHSHRPAALPRTHSPNRIGTSADSSPPRHSVTPAIQHAWRDTLRSPQRGSALALACRIGFGWTDRRADHTARQISFDFSCSDGDSGPMSPTIWYRDVVGTLRRMAEYEKYRSNF
jgi:hypothetical protein